MNRIGELRAEAGLKQSELAELLNYKQNTVSSWERGNSEPDFESLRKMAKIFGVSVDYILGGEERVPVALESDEQYLVDCTGLTDENRRAVLAFSLFLLERQNAEAGEAVAQEKRELERQRREAARLMQAAAANMDAAREALGISKAPDAAAKDPQSD